MWALAVLGVVGAGATLGLPSGTEELLSRAMVLREVEVLEFPYPLSLIHI